MQQKKFELSAQWWNALRSTQCQVYEPRKGQCIYYPKGECNKGESCRFSHSGVPNLGAGGVRQPFGQKGGKGRGRGRGRGRSNDSGNGSGNGRGGGFGYSLKTGRPYKTLAIATQAQSQRHNDSPSPKKKVKLDKEAVEEIFNAGRKSKQNRSKLTAMTMMMADSKLCSSSTSSH